MLYACLCAVASALVLPPARFAPDTVRYTVLNHGRSAGEMLVIRDGESVVVKYYHVDRNRGQRVETRYRLSASGDVLQAELRPLGLDGAAAEPTMRYRVTGDSARWTMGGGGRGRAGRAGGRGGPAAGAVRLEPDMLFALNGTPFDEALLAQQLLRRPDRSARILPSGRARLEIVADTAVRTARGMRRVRLAVVHGMSPTPGAVWLDDRNDLFASDVAWFIAVRPGDEAALPILRSVEIAWRNAQAESLAQRLVKPATGPIAIRNGDVFDSERGVMLPRTTVIIRGDRIVDVGPAESVQIPAGAQVIDATGKTVLPGLWDMHTHFQLTASPAARSPSWPRA